jgi:2-keto-3-deoxy-L-rhamnonate aldolase RhmA
MGRNITAVLALFALAACGSDAGDAGDAGDMGDTAVTSTFAGDGSALIADWADGGYAFGIFVPSAGPTQDEEGNRLPPVYTAEAAAELAQNELLDYLFLNLEYAYESAAVDAMVEGLATVSREDRPTLLVRIPTIEADGEELTRQRVAEALAHGADGVVLPHIRSPEEAALAVSFFEDIGADVWSPANPDGKIISMLMIEDGGALAAAAEIADTPGYSVLACGIGSLGGDLGDRDAAEEGCMNVKGHADRVGLPSMMTANMQILERRIDQGYRGILLQVGDDLAEIIMAGRAATGR